MVRATAKLSTVAPMTAASAVRASAVCSVRRNRRCSVRDRRMTATGARAPSRRRPDCRPGRCRRLPELSAVAGGAGRTGRHAALGRAEREQAPDGHELLAADDDGGDAGRGEERGERGAVGVRQRRGVDDALAAEDDLGARQRLDAGREAPVEADAGRQRPQDLGAEVDRHRHHLQQALGPRPERDGLVTGPAPASSRRNRPPRRAAGRGRRPGRASGRRGW